jgi:hypothetical protein
MVLSVKNNRRRWLPWAKKHHTMNNDEATFWLSQFIGKNLRIHASDGRVFGGQMKCTDKVSQAAIFCFQLKSRPLFRSSIPNWKIIVKESGNLKHWNIVVPKILLQHVIPALHFMPSPSIYFQILDPYLHCQDRNIILALAHEYRAPSAEVIRKAVEDSGNPSASVPWNSRYVGLVVVPGQHITKVEFEESTLPGQKNSVTL